jgi:hypothetical protein
MQGSSDKKVFRSFAIQVASFNYLKKFQRQYQERHKVLLNNNQTLATLLDDHKQHNERE